MVTNCPYAGINKWMEKSNIFLRKHNGKTSNNEVPIGKINIEVLEIFQNLKNIAWLILNSFTRYQCIVIRKDSWINIHKWFGCNFPTWNIRKVWRVRDDGHHCDVTSKCCGVTITTRLFEWMLSMSEINAFVCYFQELPGFKKIQMVTQIKWDKSKTTWAVGIAQLTHHSVHGGGKNPSTSGLGIFAPTLNLAVS